MSDLTSKSTVYAEWSQVVSAMVGAVAAIVAGVVGVMTLQQGATQDEQAKIQQTLAFFATFNAPNMLTVREGLETENWCARYNYYVSATYEPKVTTPQIVSVIDFFDAVHNSCTKQNLCDAQFADELFSPYAVDFYDDLSQTILERREERGSAFGVGMATLAHQQDVPIQDVVRGYREQCPTSGPAQAAPAAPAPATP